MADLIGQGGTITLDGEYTDGSGAAVDPTDPRISIIIPGGATLVALAIPTRTSLGHYAYLFVVPVDAELGAWEARWYGLINGVQVGPVDDGFTVVAAGSITPGVGGDSQVCEPWADSEDATGAAAEYGADPNDVDDAMAMASDVLYNLTGRRWPGRCSDIVRPQAQWRAGDGPKWWPAVAGVPWGFCSCHRGRETGCAHVPEIKLPGWPVEKASIVVKIDGTAFTEFDLHDGRYLVRTDGDGWPCCQNLLLDDDQPNTMSVAYRWGNGPPIGGRMACAALGSQLWMAFQGNEKCRLPKRITHITRAGTSVAVLDPLSLFKDGLTGLPEVDQWVASIRLGDARRRATVMVPGHWRSMRRVGR